MQSVRRAAAVRVLRRGARVLRGARERRRALVPPAPVRSRRARGPAQRRRLCCASSIASTRARGTHRLMQVFCLFPFSLCPSIHLRNLIKQLTK